MLPPPNGPAHYGTLAPARAYQIVPEARTNRISQLPCTVHDDDWFKPRNTFARIGDAIRKPSRLATNNEHVYQLPSVIHALRIACVPGRLGEPLSRRLLPLRVTLLTLDERLYRRPSIIFNGGLVHLQGAELRMPLDHPHHCLIFDSIAECLELSLTIHHKLCNLKATPFDGASNSRLQLDSSRLACIIGRHRYEYSRGVHTQGAESNLFTPGISVTVLLSLSSSELTPLTRGPNLLVTMASSIRCTLGGA